jgi:predicted nucleic acid-binding protein
MFSTICARNAEGLVWYLDTSAFLKLVVDEESSTAMRAWYSAQGGLWSSQLLRTEALRAAQRLQIDATLVEQALDTVSLVLPSVATYTTAGLVQPAGLRTLDALHLASALEIGADLEAMVVYDQRLVDAARENAIEVVTPT